MTPTARTSRRHSWVLPSIVSVLGSVIIMMIGIGIAKVERLIDKVETVTIQSAEIRKDIEYMQKAIGKLEKSED